MFYLLFLPGVTRVILILLIPLLALANSSLEAASLYPTQPLANTTFHGGRNNTVKWHGGHGMYMLDLMIGKDVFLYTLSKTVDAKRGNLDVYIPPRVGSDGNQYYLKFIPQHDTGNSSDIYTPRFNLDHMTGSSNATSSTDRSVAPSNSTTISVYSTSSTPPSIPYSTARVEDGDTGGIDIDRISWVILVPMISVLYFAL